MHSAYYVHMKLLHNKLNHNDLYDYGFWMTIKLVLIFAHKRYSRYGIHTYQSSPFDAITFFTHTQIFYFCFIEFT
ncbi:hypothetical protein SAMN06265337_0259 [Hymenobacter gelipurpurascens]|uniref:Uncharacterized protein n=1 Tax=Hymenobacter gelipurpurascens TaxID=89968 RepID=A0A212T312_9BACT|nr:hypothetical protein SAMN06265337_0259 [Hymenobacter gelipurpurascens]